MSELLAEPDSFEWLASGLLVDPTYGQVAGEMKSLKSHITAMIVVGIASGVPILGRFRPPRPRAVVIYVGEGGRKPYTRLLRRIAKAMGVDLASIPLYVCTDVAPIASPVFQESLLRDLREVEPALVVLDPYYAYHGGVIKASDLHQEGGLLSGLSSRCLDNGASLLITNHLNQTGSGLDLKRITMAGSGEWVDSWVLVAHREKPDVPAGEFKLRLDIGSRQWGGGSFDVDVSVGAFDEEAGHHDGDIGWDLRRADGSGSGPGRDDTAKRAIVETLTDRPGLTKTDLYGHVRGNRESFHRAMADLAEKGVIAHDMAGRKPDSGPARGLKWYLAAVTDQPVGPLGGDDRAA